MRLDMCVGLLVPVFLLLCIISTYFFICWIQYLGWLVGWLIPKLKKKKQNYLQ